MTEYPEPHVLSELDSTLGEQVIAAAAGLAPLTAREQLGARFPSVPPEVLRAALEQADLRTRARRRFPDAAAMLWTRDGLEQASRPAVSAYRARTIRDLGIEQVVDLTCGLGLDLVGLAAAGLHVTGIEQDPMTAALAARNVVRAGGKSVSVRVGSCTDESILRDLPSDAAWFVDPARRDRARDVSGAHRRIDDPQRWSPPWSWVRQLADRVGTDTGPRVLVAKTAPALNDFGSAAVQWLSVDGDLVEATAWWGIGDAKSRCAVLLDDAGETRSVICAGGSPITPSGLPEPGDWLFEPDPAVIRAGALTDLAHLLGAGLVDAHLAYLRSNGPSTHPAVARQWWVVYAGRYDRRVLSEMCRDLGITRVDLIGRGRRFDAARVRRELGLPGGPGRAAALHTLALGDRRRSAVVLGLAHTQSDG